MTHRRNDPSNRVRGKGEGTQSRRFPRLASIALVAGMLIAAGSLLDAGGAEAQTRPPLQLGEPAPEFQFTTVDGAKRRLSEFRGQPVMLWLFATWCPSCVTATAAIAENYQRLNAAGLQIIQLKLFGNLGYQGPTTSEFAARNAGPLATHPGWLWGEASREGSFTYDPRGYPDIYFLIDKDGVLRDADLTPHITMHKILKFVGAGS